MILAFLFRIRTKCVHFDLQWSTEYNSRFYGILILLKLQNGNSLDAWATFPLSLPISLPVLFKHYPNFFRPSKWMRPTASQHASFCDNYTVS